ncbi:MAG: hypothetical protein ACRCZI_13010 [Cetobacterium sp.]
MGLLLSALKIKSAEKQINKPLELDEFGQIEEPQSIKQKAYKQEEIEQIEEPQSIKQDTDFFTSLSPEEYKQMLITDMIYITHRRW